MGLDELINERCKDDFRVFSSRPPKFSGSARYGGDDFDEAWDEYDTLSMMIEEGGKNDCAELQCRSKMDNDWISVLRWCPNDPENPDEERFP